MSCNRIITGKCEEILYGIPKGGADLVFADPPFNIDYQYDEYHDHMSAKDYMHWTKKWLTAVTRHALSKVGSLYIAIGDEYVAPIKCWLDECELTLRNWIVWSYGFGQHCETKFGRSHAHILYYVMDPKDFTFNADKIRVPSRRQDTYGDKRANPKGRVPSDVWDIPRLCGTHRERTGDHPCQMPEAVLERIIRASSNKGDVVLDPFSGSGTTCAVAKRLGRRYLGVELSENYAAASRKRLAGVIPGLV